MFWILYLVNRLFLFCYLFSQLFSLTLSIDSSPSGFSFCFTFYASMNLGEIVSCYGLEEVGVSITVWMYPVFLVEDMDLMWTQVMSFLRVYFLEVGGFVILLYVYIRERDDRGWDDWMASPTLWTWVWVSSRSWWWIGKPGVLQSMGSQRVRHDWVTELNWTAMYIWYWCFLVHMALLSSDIKFISSKMYSAVSPWIYTMIQWYISEGSY